MRTVRSAMSSRSAAADKTLFFKGKSASVLDTTTAHGRQVGRAAREPDSRGRVAPNGRPPRLQCAYLPAQRPLGAAAWVVLV